MKTMWFTFLYCSAIPLGSLWSMLGLTIYYYADKHNVIHRRTISESLGYALTEEMIDSLEFCVIFHCFGNFFFKL
jgi:hypothetical protein